MDPRLSELVDLKIEQLRHYNEITSRIIYEDIDGVGELIERRQEIVTAVDGISMEMKALINQQSIERKDTINALLGFEEISGLTGAMAELAEKIAKLRKVTDEAIANERAAQEKLTKVRDEIYSELSKSAKGKKLVNYFGATAVDVTKGSKFNQTN